MDRKEDIKYYVYFLNSNTRFQVSSEYEGVFICSKTKISSVLEYVDSNDETVFAAMYENGLTKTVDGVNYRDLCTDFYVCVLGDTKDADIRFKVEGLKEAKKLCKRIMGECVLEYYRKIDGEMEYAKFYKNGKEG